MISPKPVGFRAWENSTTFEVQGFRASGARLRVYEGSLVEVDC